MERGDVTTKILPDNADDGVSKSYYIKNACKIHSLALQRTMFRHLPSVCLQMKNKSVFAFSFNNKLTLHGIYGNILNRT